MRASKIARPYRQTLPACNAVACSPHKGAALRVQRTVRTRMRHSSDLSESQHKLVQITNALLVLEKDPCVTCISVHNTFKHDFVADDILRGVRARA